MKKQIYYNVKIKLAWPAAPSARAQLTGRLGKKNIILAILYYIVVL
jgi:hypothetical protein